MAYENFNPSQEEIKDKDSFASFKLVYKPSLAKQAARWCSGIFLVLILSLLLPWTQNIDGKGELTTLNPQDRPQTVHSIIAGRIEKWLIREGQFVKKGDTIAVISEVKDKFFDPELLLRIDEQIKAKEGALQSTKDKATALRNQITALEDGLKFSLGKAKNKVKQSILKLQSDSIDFIAAKTDFEIAKQRLERQEALYKKGLISLTDIESRRLKVQETSAKLLSSENKFLNAKNDLKNTQIELNSIEAEYLDKISKAESDLSSTLGYFYDTEGAISKMNNEYASMQIRSSYYTIVAPQSGYVVKTLKSGIGETVKDGEEIVSIMPESPRLAVSVYVRPADVPLLKKGGKVRIQFDGWPALVFSGWPGASFGTFGGVISVIDYVDTKGKYRVLVVPDSNDEPWPKQVRIGSGTFGWVMLKTVSVGYELWRNLNAFPPDFLDELESPQKEKTKDNAKDEKEE
jgi:multidrug efflux pump subunit AcrA (membrane-fusion protein)